MSAVPNVAPIKAHQPLEVTVRGRIEASRVHESKRYTRIIAPAADAYSRPQTLEVRSSRSKLGEVGDEISITARLGGYTRKSYRVTDKDTGEVSMVTPVDLTLDLVE